MGNATSGKAVLEDIRKQAEQASKQHYSMASTSVSASRILPSVPSLTPLDYGTSSVR